MELVEMMTVSEMGLWSPLVAQTEQQKGGSGLTVADSLFENENKGVVNVRTMGVKKRKKKGVSFAGFF